VSAIFFVEKKIDIYINNYSYWLYYFYKCIIEDNKNNVNKYK
jgi:hypothetical protein